MTLHDEIKELVNEYGERAVLAAAERMVDGQRNGWQPIKTAPTNSKQMFAVIAVNVPFGKDRRYTTDPYCVWNEGGKFVRWPHKFQPTHWMNLPDPPA